MNSRHFTPPYDEPERPEGAYKEFNATELYCARCKRSVPVRERLLLVLPDGEKFEYLCGLCGNSVGSKMDKSKRPMSIII